MFLFSSPKWNTKIYYWQTFSKYLNSYMNHNLTRKLKKILIPITQGSPNTRYIHQTHYVSTHRETKA